MTTFELTVLNLKKLSSADLMKSAHGAVKNERHALTIVLRHFREIEARGLHFERGFESLLDFCIKELGYSKPAALRRIGAMRLSREIPELENQINKGEITLSVAAMAQSTFRIQERLSKSEVTDKNFQAVKPLLDVQHKTELLKQLSGQSIEEAQKTLFRHFPSVLNEKILADKKKNISDKLCEIKFVADTELQKEIEDVKFLLSHKNPNMGFAELLKELIQIAKKQIDPRLKKGKVIRREIQTFRSAADLESRYIPQEIKKEVWLRDKGCCQFKDPLTQRICQSRFQLQIEHRIAKALGGSETLENLELLCRNHNYFRATKAFGNFQMKKYSRNIS